VLEGAEANLGRSGQMAGRKVAPTIAAITGWCVCVPLHFLLITVLCTALVVSGCASSTRIVGPTSPAAVGEIGHGFLKGYLSPEELPDSLALLPAPPAADSAAQADDDAAFHELTKLLGTPRGAMAVRDANLSFPQAAEVFSCALGISISEQETPNLNMLLRRSMTDAGLATYKAKNKYQRTRPFVVFKVPSCTPAEDGFLAQDGSYPSGHTSLGWTWALVLTELAPDRADAILERGRAFGQSRGICGAHWKSDIESGRVIGAATSARLHTNPAFNAQMEAARAEVAKARSRGAAPPGNCAAEAVTLEISSSLAP
jgi:acid phosphatase (class A)